MTLKTEQSTFEERWTEIRSIVKERWPELSDDELNMIDGDSRKLIAVVHQKTGAEIHDIEVAINEITTSSETFATRVVQPIRSAVSQAKDRAAEPIAQAYRQSSDTVAEYPEAAVTISFIAGVVTGLIGMTRYLEAREAARRRRSHWWQ